MNIIEELTEIFRKFPGVGPRQAERFVYYLLKQKNSYLDKLSRLIPELNQKVKNCQSCKRFYISENQNQNICNICSDKNRNFEILMIVARDVDLISIEKSNTFNGYYFVLGGLVPVLDKEPQNKIRLFELSNEIKNKKDFLKEIIIALSANPEGDNTAEIIKKELKEMLKDYSIKISILGRGLSTGTELEYSDKETIKNALKNRF
ncbi:MAG TPA: toprim domain-containing protein [Candidatus Paceibacterota bacterium]|nr:toprim domain-containing protein [Candidatus Paceibacterota bacterium]HMP18725.1 toprim domain-containing protein [Candidatus Paceibacterota bacterium]HMP85591.1 toprim domain-containing protein [Candidatus Paceibacterota bacterium]